MRLACVRAFCTLGAFSRPVRVQGYRAGLLGTRSARRACFSTEGQPYIVMGIESSCDDTGVGIVTSDGRILSSELVSQAALHARWGGVVPSLARDAHAEAMQGCIKRAIERAGVKPAELDAIAVTIGPGLSLCLAVGVRAARKLAFQLNKPLIPVHHMEAHALVARLGVGTDPDSEGKDETSSTNTNPTFPFLCVLVSGGHNLLLIAHGVGDYTLLGTTLDDALGEAYDKAARLLGLDPKPSGGAAVEAAAKRGNAKAYAFPVPLTRQPNCNFSYAGLKTSLRSAVERELRAAGATTIGCIGTVLPASIVNDLAASFQHAAIRHLAQRVQRGVDWALETDPRIRHLVLAGGVARNAMVRAQLQEIALKSGLELVAPLPELCSDNGVMVAWAALESLAAGSVSLDDGLLQVGGDPSSSADDDGWVDVRARWPLTARRHPRMAAEAPRSAKKKRIFPPLSQVLAHSGEVEGCKQ